MHILMIMFALLKIQEINKSVNLLCCQSCLFQFCVVRVVFVFSFVLSGLSLFSVLCCQSCLCFQFCVVRVVFVFSFVLSGLCLFSVLCCQGCVCFQFCVVRVVFVFSFVLSELCLFSVLCFHYWWFKDRLVHITTILL